MEKSTRAELIAALVTDKYSGFRNGDEAMLESAADVRLEEFRTASETNRTTASTIARMETEQRNTAARLKVAEERLVTAESTMSEEDFIARLDPKSKIKTLLESRAAEDKALHASLVSQLRNLGGETEEDLKKKTTEELQVLARYAGVKVHARGRGLPASRSAQEQPTTYAPPDPYADAVVKHRAAEKF